MTTPELPIDVLILPDQTSDPATASGSAKQYGKAVGGITHLHGMSGGGTVGQLTPPTYAAGSLTYANRASYFTWGNDSTIDNTVTSLVNVFPTGQASITSLPTGSYQFRAQYLLVSATSPTPPAATWSTAFGGTATYSSFRYFARSVFYSNSAANVSANNGTEMSTVTSASSAVIRGSNASANLCVLLDGFFTVSVAGSFTPQIQTNATRPSNQMTVRSASFIEIIPLTASFVSQGAWGS